jgi:hypothetical protein
LKNPLDRLWQPPARGSHNPVHPQSVPGDLRCFIRISRDFLQTALADRPRRGYYFDESKNILPLVEFGDAPGGLAAVAI